MTRTLCATRWLWVGVGLMLAACSELPNVGNPTSCAEDDECSRFQVCIIGVCANSLDQRLGRVHLEVRPAESDGLRPQQIFDVQVGPESEGGRTDVRLAPTLSVRGNVVDELGSPIPADLVAVPVAAIPGRALVSSAVAAGAQGAFALPVVPTLADSSASTAAFRLSVLPEDDHLYPPAFGTLRVRPPRAGESEWELGPVTMPAAETLLPVTGRIVTSDGIVQLPLSGLDVRLLDDGQRVSSTGVTDTDGYFSLYVLPDAAPLLTLEARPTEFSGLSPTLRIVDVDWTSELSIDVGALAAPVPFRGTVRGPAGAPVPYATIYARQLRIDAELVAIIAADENGAYDVELRPGRYVFAVVPPTSQPAAGVLVGFEATVELDASPVFNLPARLPLAGQVTAAGGEVVPGAELRFTRIAGQDGTAEPLLADVQWRFVGRSDASGAFALDVDKGRYRVEVLPDPGSALPLLTRIVDIDDAEEDLRFTLPRAAWVAGALVGPNGNPVPHAQVAVYSSLVGEAGEALWLGSALSGADGLFEVIVPDLESE